MAAHARREATGTTRVRCRLPLLWRRSVVFRVGAEGLATVTLVWASPGQWRRLRSRGEAGWCTMAVGGFTLAVRLDVTGVW